MSRREGHCAPVKESSGMCKEWNRLDDTVGREIEPNRVLLEGSKGMKQENTLHGHHKVSDPFL